MLTVAYCRVSTEEQAEEGFSVDGQADKLRSYAELRELGSVTVIADPGISGKSLNRPGVQQLLEAVEAGYVTTVLVWRLDRLSRNLQDLILLADLFGTHGVALHSVSENLDLSSAAGRMFYNILGTFAQYFREQLAENVKMGNERALREGRYINRPKFGYDLVDGQLVTNEKAVIVREIFRLRAEGESYRTIEERTGVLYSSVSSILQSRVYVGERPRHGGYLPGSHEPIVTGEEWQAANKRLRRGRHTSTDPLAGHVVCGLCSKRMAVAQNGQGSRAYKCRSRGQGCAIPARSNLGLARAAVLGLQLLADDEGLQAAIRRRLAGAARAGGRPHGRRRRSAAGTLGDLSAKRQKLLELYYAGKITPEGFHEEEQRLAALTEAASSQAREELQGQQSASACLESFEELLDELKGLDFETVWAEASDLERQVLVDELVDSVTVFDDHLEVKVANSPTLNVLLGEVGLKESESVGVGGGT